MKNSNLPVAIIGLGKTGVSVAKYLKINNKNFIAYDTRENLKITDEIKKYVDSQRIVLGKLEKSFIDKHDCFIVSPGVKIEKQFLKKIIKNKKNIQTDIDIFNESCNGKTICITGSNGKTTVTAILEYVLRKMGKKVKAGGNIGLPALELTYENYEYNILELSSFQLEMTKKINCITSLITNITEDHLDRHETLENYINIKHKIFNNAENIIINRNDNNIRKEKVIYKYTFGSDEPKNNNSFGIRIKNKKKYIYHGNKKILEEDEIQLIGLHNLVNICSCLSIIQSIGEDVNDALQYIRKFECIDHRMEKFLYKDDIKWINDSKATNIESTISALNSLDENIILILGGKSKTNNYKKLNEIIGKKVSALILFGECKNLLNREITSISNIFLADNINAASEKARLYAKKIIEKESMPVCILLSPACASYDMFESFEERGILFKKFVMENYS